MGDGGGRKRGSLPCPWADNGPPEEITALPALRSGASCAAKAQPWKGPRKGQRRRREARSCSRRSLPRLAGSSMPRHPSTVALSPQGHGLGLAKRERGQKVGKLKRGEAGSPQLPPPRLPAQQAETDAIRALRFPCCEVRSQKRLPSAKERVRRQGTAIPQWRQERK